MQRRIQILNPLLANQIAAGEVIERPAAVVKELIENSLDAGATQLDIHIEKGGVQRIHIRDDGTGIHSEDLALALSRHATSKIYELSELECVQSLGFRGEALASIAAVSRLKLISKHRTADSAWQIQVEGIAHAPMLEPAAHPDGTTVEIHDLFFNTPVRRKFLRSEKTEFTHIEEVVKRVALSHFGVGFQLKHNQRTVLQLSKASTPSEHEQRLAKLCGMAFMEHALRIEFEAMGLQLVGWIALPTFSRSQADMQYCYVNGRMVKDKLLSHAIKQAYHDVLYGDRHPAYVLFLTLDPAMVDVNVHPTKHEVRFRESRSVHSFLRHSVKQALAEASPGMTPTHLEPLKEPIVEEQTDTIALVENSLVTPLASIGLDKKPSPTKTAVYAPPLRQTQLPLEAREYLPAYQALYGAQDQTPATSDSETAVLAPASIQPTEHKASDEPPFLGYAIGQIQYTYIIAENAQGMVVIDMHAAHERILYEQLKTAYLQGKLTGQELLIPHLLTITEKEGDSLQQHQALFTDLGFIVERMGIHSCAIRQVPTILQNMRYEQLVQDMLTDLANQENTERAQETLMAILGNLACRSAVHTQRKLSLAEMNSLLRDMEKTPNSGYCNHGRPTVRQFSLAELDKWFLRGR